MNDSTTPKSLKRRVLITVGMTALGLLGGYLYYHFIGCNGSCAITSFAGRSTLYGGLIGAVLSFAF